MPSQRKYTEEHRREIKTEIVYAFKKYTIKDLTSTIFWLNYWNYKGKSIQLGNETFYY